MALRKVQKALQGKKTAGYNQRGAYTLYESELSRGLITDKMYLIVSQPEDFKEHLPALYDELSGKL